MYWALGEVIRADAGIRDEDSADQAWAKIKSLSDEVEKHFPRSGGQRWHIRQYKLWRALREVYPGFLQIGGFMSMNLDRHMQAHRDLFHNLVKGDGDSAQKHREFYDEYLAVMDLAAEFYLQTVETVFIRHALPKGEMTHRGRKIDPTLGLERRFIRASYGARCDLSLGVGPHHLEVAQP